jgi:hypothetical protein
MRLALAVGFRSYLLHHKQTETGMQALKKRDFDTPDSLTSPNLLIAQS